jgi:amino acid permease
MRYTLVTLTFLCSALLVALLVDDLSLVLELVGATGSTIVSYLLPGATYMKLHPYQHLRRTLARAQFLVGLVVIAVGLTSVFLKAK